MAQSSEGAYIDKLLKSGKLKPEAVARLYREYAEGKSRIEIIEGITTKDYFIDPSKEKSTAAQQKQIQQKKIGQDLLDALSGQLGQEAQGFNEMLQGPAQPMPQEVMSPGMQLGMGDMPRMNMGQGGIQLGQGATMPQLQVQPEGLLTQPQQGIFEFLKQSPGALGADPLKKGAELFPRQLGVKKEITPKEYKTFAQKKRYYDLLGVSKTTAKDREKRLSLADDRRYEIAVIRAGIATEDLDLKNRKYLIELAKMEEGSDFKILNTLLEHARTLQPGAPMTNDLLGQAIEQLKVLNPRFGKVHKRAVKRVKNWHFWTKPTLKEVEEIDPYEDLF